jgi:uncharacterized protein
MIQVQTQRFEG